MSKALLVLEDGLQQMRLQMKMKSAGLVRIRGGAHPRKLPGEASVVQMQRLSAGGRHGGREGFADRHRAPLKSPDDQDAHRRAPESACRILRAGSVGRGVQEEAVCTERKVVTSFAP